MDQQNEISNVSTWPRISLYWRNEKSRICIRKSPRLGDIWAPCRFFANGRLAVMRQYGSRNPPIFPKISFSRILAILHWCLTRSNTRMDGSSINC